MMKIMARFERIVAGMCIGLLVFNMGASAALAQMSLSNLVTDTTGSIAAATIACNKDDIHSAIKNLFTSQSSSPGSLTGGSPSSDASGTITTTATGLATDIWGNGSTSSSGSSDQLVHLSPSDQTNRNIQSAAQSSASAANSAATTAAATSAASKKETCTNAIEKAAAGAILRQITLSTVNWINHGFNGNPLYIKDTSSQLKAIGDQEVRNFTSLIAYDGTNYPFGRQTALSFLNQLQSGFSTRAQYSLDSVIAQEYPGRKTTDYLNDFAVGGWNAFISQFAENNNPVGFNMAANNELSSRLADTSYSPAQDLKDQLLRSGGFMDQRVCVAPGSYDPVSSPSRVQADQDLMKSPGYAQYTADQKKSVQDDIAANTCVRWATQTPGSVIAHALNTSIDIPTNQLINGQDLSADITAIFNALLNQLMNKGLSYLSANSGNSNPSSTNLASSFPNVTQVGTGQDGYGNWASQGQNFNVFTDIPKVLRIEDNDLSQTTLKPGCTSADQFASDNHLCAGDQSLPEGYQQILKKQIGAGNSLLSAAYQLDYCVPGPHPSWEPDAAANVQNFVSDPTLFPASASPSDLHKLLSKYGQTTGTVVGIVAGAAIGATVGSVVPGLGTAIGAVIGAVVGIILQAIGNDNNKKNEYVYGKFVSAVLGVGIESKGGGKEHVNGHDNSSHIFTTLAPRYAAAIEKVYNPSSSAVAAAEADAAANPNDAAKAAMAKEMEASAAAFADIADLTALDNTEMAKAQADRDAITQNQALYDKSVSMEVQLEHLQDRINELPSQDGYPGAGTDYNKDYLAVQNVTNLSTLSDYQMELRRINDTFTQMAPYLHSTDDLKEQEALAFALTSEADSLTGSKGAIQECVSEMTNPNSRYNKDGGPQGRILFSFVGADGKTIQALPSSLTSTLKPTRSFLPDWHYAQGNGLILLNYDPFAATNNASIATDDPDISTEFDPSQRFFFPYFHGSTMQIVGGADHLQSVGGLTIDTNHLIQNDDIVTINAQPIKNALEGLEHSMGVY